MFLGVPNAPKTLMILCKRGQMSPKTLFKYKDAVTMENPHKRTFLSEGNIGLSTHCSMMVWDTGFLRKRLCHHNNPLTIWPCWNHKCCFAALQLQSRVFVVPSLNKTHLHPDLLPIRTDKRNKKWVTNPCLPVTHASACTHQMSPLRECFLFSRLPRFQLPRGSPGGNLILKTCTHPYYTLVYVPEWLYSPLTTNS